MPDLNILDSDSNEDHSDSRFNSIEKKFLAAIAQWAKLIGVFSILIFTYVAFDLFFSINLISHISRIGYFDIIFILLYLGVYILILIGCINLIRFSNYMIYTISGHDKSFQRAIKYLRIFFRVLGLLVTTIILYLILFLLLRQ